MSDEPVHTALHYKKGWQQAYKIKFESEPVLQLSITEK